MLLVHFLAVPRIVPRQPRHGTEDRIFGGVNVSGGNRDGAVPSDSGECPNVSPGRPQASQKSVAKTVEDKWPDLGDLESFCVLLLKARRLDVSALAWCGPYVVFNGPSLGFPARF